MRPKIILRLVCPNQCNLTFVCPCIASVTVNDDQQDANILVYLFIPNQLYMFRANDDQQDANILVYLLIPNQLYMFRANDDKQDANILVYLLIPNQLYMFRAKT